MGAYTAGQVVANIIFLAFAGWLIYRARLLQKNENKGAGKTIGMVFLYITGSLIIIGMLAELAGVGR